MYLGIVAPPTPLCIVDRRLTIIPQSVWGCDKCSEHLSCYLRRSSIIHSCRPTRILNSTAPSCGSPKGPKTVKLETGVEECFA